jgi:hypothetical protein
MAVTEVVNAVQEVEIQLWTRIRGTREGSWGGGGANLHQGPQAGIEGGGSNPEPAFPGGGGGEYADSGVLRGGEGWLVVIRLHVVCSVVNPGNVIAKNWSSRYNRGTELNCKGFVKQGGSRSSLPRVRRNSFPTLEKWEIMGSQTNPNSDGGGTCILP